MFLHRVVRGQKRISFGQEWLRCSGFCESHFVKQPGQISGLVAHTHHNKTHSSHEDPQIVRDSRSGLGRVRCHCFVCRPFSARRVQWVLQVGQGPMRLQGRRLLQEGLQEVIRSHIHPYLQTRRSRPVWARIEQASPIPEAPFLRTFWVAPKSPNWIPNPVLAGRSPRFRFHSGHGTIRGDRTDAGYLQ